MIKKQNKIVLTLFMLLSLVLTTDVKAATMHYIGGQDTGIKLVDDKGQEHNYKDSYFKIDFNGKTYDGYCVDPGYAMKGAVEATCEPLTSKPAMSWLMQNLTGNHAIDQLAIRMLAIREDINKNISKFGTGIVLYLEDRLKGLSSQRLYGSDIIDKAYDLHLEAMNHKNDPYTETALNLYKTGGSGATVTYNVTSNKYINPSSLKFTCDGGCSIESKTWNGTSGTLTVKAIPESANPTTNNCSFTINAYYPTSGVYICSTNSINFQNILINANTDFISGEVTGEATQKIPVSIDATTGKEYYQTYCNGPDNCNQKTEVYIPNYCDTSADEEVRITAPTDVKACILNGKDEAGNTYQSSAVDSSNPYCSVFCKEDYKSTLPGAQYTTSGKYFKFEKNVIASGTRSCYVTGSQTGNGTEGIDLVQYKKDIVARQKKLVDEFNAYNKAKTIYDNKDKATSSTTTNCEGTETYTKYTLASQSYTSYTYNCNESTGKCTLTQTTSQTGTVTWGQSANNSTGTDSQSSSSKLDGYNCSWNSTTRQYDCSKSTCTSGSPNDEGSEPTEPTTNGITTATNNLKTAITNIKACYNWTNDYCFNPELEFDYKEQYNTDINFEKIAGSETESSSVSIGTTIDQEYNTNNSGSITETINYIGCTSDGCISNGNVAENISSTVTYIKKVVNKSAEYNNKQSFQANYPHGTIDTVSDPSKIRENYSYLGAVFPVALKTTKGVYNWTLNFENVGQYNNENSCRLGRLNKVSTALGKTLEDEIGYVCVYVVDCDDCDYECNCPENLPDGYSCVKKSKFVCEIKGPDPKCDECEVYCVNCIFDGKDTYGYRTISLSNINPNNRTMGSNWTSEKGASTKAEIEKKNEEAYKKPEYSYTITATQMKNIRDYNKQKGTYVAEDLSYHKIGSYDNVYGTSSFLDKGVAKGYFTENARNTNWTLWTGTINTNGLGPSWK